MAKFSLVKREDLTRALSPVKLTLIGVRVGSTVAKAVLSTAVAGQLRPEVIGDAILSSSSVRSHVQLETLHIIALRLSGRVPRHLHWLLQLIAEYLRRQSTGQALCSLSQRTLCYHVTAFGVRGMTASALAAAAVQLSIATCCLATSNARAYWCRRKRMALVQNDKNNDGGGSSSEKMYNSDTHSTDDTCATLDRNKTTYSDDYYCFRDIGVSRASHSRMSLSQYRYDALTVVYSALMTVVGSGVGAALGSMVLPGFGTALGSIVCSSGCGLLPGYVRHHRGPDDVARRQNGHLASICALRMKDEEDDFVHLSHAEEAVLVERKGGWNAKRDVDNEKSRFSTLCGSSIREKHDVDIHGSNRGVRGDGRVGITREGPDGVESWRNDSCVILDVHRVSPHEEGSAPSLISSAASLSSASSFFSSCSSWVNYASESTAASSAPLSSQWSRRGAASSADANSALRDSTTSMKDNDTRGSTHGLRRSDNGNHGNKDHDGVHGNAHTYSCTAKDRRVTSREEAEEQVMYDRLDRKVEQHEQQQQTAPIPSQLLFAHDSDMQAPLHAIEDICDGRVCNTANNKVDIYGNDAWHTMLVREATDVPEGGSMQPYRANPATSQQGNPTVCARDCGDGLQRQIMCGQLEYMDDTKSWEEVDAFVDKFGDDEIVLIFASPK